MNNPLPLVGLYGGTFDPIHFGHLNLALQIAEQCNLQEVWFCPARVSPHRMQSPPTQAHHRLEMLRRAIAPIPFFRVIENELMREGPSYTIDTVRELTERHGEQFRLVLADEVALGLPRWKESLEILRLAPPLIGRRLSDSQTPPQTGDRKIDQALAKGFVQTDLFQITGTAIRKRIQEKLPCNYLLPADVLAYIHKHKLYIGDNA